MATLILGGIGTALGGPIGGAVGALLGQSLDQGFFGSTRRQARLSDLSVQSSSYGNSIPRIYGKMRVAGTVVWATDLLEQPAAGGGYLYSASFAVALSSRPIIGIERIWADGKLLRGAAGDFKVRTGFRVQDGSADQSPDPLISSIEGVGQTPGYRGLALAVFEDLHLAEFGNRIPSLSFEVVADAADIDLGFILQDASGGAIQSEDSTPIQGYAAYGRDVADAIAPLVSAHGVQLAEDGDRMVDAASSDIVRVDDLQLGCSTESGRVPRRARAHSSIDDSPYRLSLTFYEPTRDYQSGQVHSLSGNRNGAAERLELPIVMHSSVAKALTEQMLVERSAARDELTVHLPPTFLDLKVGTILQIDDDPASWRVQEVSLEELVVTARMVRAGRPMRRTLRSDAGRIASQSDKLPTATALLVFEVPASSGSADQIEVQIAAAGGSDPWRPVPIQVRAGGSEWTVASARKRAIIGTSVQELPASDSNVLDLLNSVEVQLAHDDWLLSCDDAALAAGVNLALLGPELLQFGCVEPLGDRRFRLSKLLRGRRGTEEGSAGHKRGETFVLLDPSSLTSVHLPVSLLGSEIELRALGIGDPVEGTCARISLEGKSLRPPSPAHLRCSEDTAGGLRVSWVRRDRAGWAWLDHVDVPLSEGAQTYLVAIEGAEGRLEKSVPATSSIFSPNEVAVLGAKPWTCSVSQMGEFAISEAAVVSVVA